MNEGENVFIFPSLLNAGKKREKLIKSEKFGNARH